MHEQLCELIVGTVCGLSAVALPFAVAGAFGNWTASTPGQVIAYLTLFCAPWTINILRGGHPDLRTIITRPTDETARAVVGLVILAIATFVSHGLFFPYIWSFLLVLHFVIDLKDEPSG